ncbi:class F sortase [Streptomyces sp. NPDC003719]
MARRLTGPGVTAAALAVAVTLVSAPSQQASPPADFGRSTARSAAAPDRPVQVGAARSPSPVDHAAAPVRVLVRSVGLDARVSPVGVTEAGDMAVPPDPGVAGWYRFGPAPGSAHGSAVLVGHVDGDTGELGEFASLYDVRPGDRVEVRRAGAEPAGYRIVARSTVPRDAIPASAFRRGGPPVLTLITCAPPFVPEDGGYQANLIVTAEPAGG